MSAPAAPPAGTPDPAQAQQADPMLVAPSMPETEASIRRSLQVANAGVQASNDPREAKEWAAAVLALSQSLVILDPKLVAPQGVPIDAIHPPAPRSNAAKIPTDKSQSAQAS